MKKLAIYIHWPWCKKKCPYCDFNSHVLTKDITDDYVKAVIADMQYQSKRTPIKRVKSVFFGGGTPSLISEKHLEMLLEEIQRLFIVDKDVEITLEANPTSVDTQKFKNFKEIGINRLSLGIQSLQEKHLKFLGREHSAKMALNSLEYINSIYNNTSVDFIYGLPNQTLSSWIDDLSTIVSLGTTHISAYQLTIEPQTKFFSDVKKGKWSPLDDDDQATFMKETLSFLKSHNFKQYEISNFSTRSNDCKHNTHIWQYGSYLGLGAGAHGRLETVENTTISTRNFRMPHTYISSVERVEHGLYETETIPKDIQSKEKVITGLRLNEGVQLDEHINKILNKQALKKFFSLNMIHKSNNRLALTDEGFLLMDYLLCDLIL